MMDEHSGHDPLNLFDTQSSDRVSDHGLNRLRAQNPFLQIIKFPNKTLGYYLLANIAVDVAIPPGTTLIRFTGSGNYWISAQGAAVVPIDIPDPFNEMPGSIYKPEGTFFYVENRLNVSIVSNAAVTVTVWFYTQE